MQPKPVDLSKSGLPPGVFPQKKSAPANPTTVVPPVAPTVPTGLEPPVAEAPAAKPTCRRCGSDPTADPDHIAPEDLIAFSKSVWRDEPFSKTYHLFGGAVRVVFRSISADEIEASQRAVLAEAAKNDQASGLLGVFSLGERGEEFQLAYSIGQLTIGDKNYQRPAAVKSPVDTLADVRAVSGGNIAYQSIRTVWREFYSLVQRLIAAGSNPSFWEATRSPGQSQSSPTTATQS